MLTIKNFDIIELEQLNRGWVITATAKFDDRYVVMLRDTSGMRKSRELTIWRHDVVSAFLDDFLYKIKFDVQPFSHEPIETFRTKSNFLKLISNLIDKHVTI